jgi:hypothetical protein
MGRPIKGKFFGYAATGGQFDSSGFKVGTAGEGIASIKVNTSTSWGGTVGTGTNYSFGTVATVTAPQITGGKTATITPVINSAGTITNFTIINAGSGYNTTATIFIQLSTATAQSASVTTNTTQAFTLTGVNGIYTGMKVTGTGVQTSPPTFVGTISTATLTIQVTQPFTAGDMRPNTISFYDAGAGFVNATTNTVITLTSGNGVSTINFTAYLSTGSSAIGNGVIIKQRGSRSYFVENAQGRGTVKLTATNTLAAGQMNIIATDYTGAQYFIDKLGTRKAHLVQYRLNSAASYLINSSQNGNTAVAKWTTLSNKLITGTNIVSIATTV